MPAPEQLQQMFERLAAPVWAALASDEAATPGRGSDEATVSVNR